MAGRRVVCFFWRGTWRANDATSSAKRIRTRPRRALAGEHFGALPKNDHHHTEDICGAVLNVLSLGQRHQQDMSVGVGG